MAKYNKRDCDFSGWVTRNDILCTDGRTIKNGAFAHCNGKAVPLVWNHSHDNPLNVLGQVLLEDRPPTGVYGYGFFNDTEFGDAAKRQVMHGDITSLSVCANHVKQRGGDVLHGDIKEVSLVLSGANKGARIDYVLNHSDSEDGDEALIYCDCTDEFYTHDDSSEDDDMNNGEFYHSDDNIDVEALARSLTDEQKAMVLQVLSETLGLSLQHADDDLGGLRAIINGLSRDERNALLYILTKDMNLEHYDNSYDGFNHSSDLTPEEVLGTLMTLNDDQMNAVYCLLGEIAIGGDSIEHADEAIGDIYGNNTISTGALLSTLTPRQADCVMAFLAYADDNKFELMHNDDVINAYYGYDDDATILQGDDDDMKWNAFEDNYTGEDNGIEFTQADMDAIFEDGKRFGSLKESFIAHADEYGIENLDYLFPDPKSLSDEPLFVQRKVEWVDKVFDGAHAVPFSRIKSIYANITEDEARAKGYIKGTKKKEEVFALLKRVTTPKTVYKLQKFDKDDIDDLNNVITVAWVKKEMVMMLREEFARSFLIGDGRSIDDPYHITEDHIRPIATDRDFYSIKVKVKTNNDRSKVAKEFINQVVRSRKDYRGTGSPTLFTTDEMVCEMLLLEDGIGHKLYKGKSELATALLVKEVVAVPVMENQRNSSNEPYLGILVNMDDYYRASNDNGKIGMFDDFDIDYNQYKYLIEARMAGALHIPYSAVVFSEGSTNSTTGFGGNTIPTGDMNAS